MAQFAVMLTARNGYQPGDFAHVLNPPQEDWGYVIDKRQWDKAVAKGDREGPWPGQGKWAVLIIPDMSRQAAANYHRQVFRAPSVVSNSEMIDGGLVPLHNADWGIDLSALPADMATELNAGLLNRNRGQVQAFIKSKQNPGAVFE